MMTYHLLFVVLMILLDPAFLVRGDDDQDQLSTTASTSDPQPGSDPAIHNSSLNYDPIKNLSLSLQKMPSDDCTSASDCGFIGAICSDKNKKCFCPYGQKDVQWGDEPSACQKSHCSTDKACGKDHEQVCGSDGFCECAPGYAPDQQNIECVKSESTSGTANSEESKVGKGPSFPWYWFLVIPIVLLLLCGGLVAVLIFCGLCVSCGLGGGGNSRGVRSTPRSCRGNKSKKRSKRSSKGSRFRSSKAGSSKAVR